MVHRRRILLVVPALPAVRVTANRPLRQSPLFTLPYLGLLNLAALTPRAWEVRVVNEHVEPLDVDQPAELVGITTMTPTAPRAYEIAAAFRRRGIPVVLGGLHPTNEPDEAGQHADAVVRGEAESIWPRLLTDAAEGRLRARYDKAPPFDLAELPVPRRELVAHERNPYDAIQATRGCVHRCDFCCVPGLHDRVYRVRPVGRIVEELRGLRGRVVTFVDDHLTAHRDWAKELFRAMRPLGKTWVSMATVEIAEDDELLSLARQSGCLGFFLGLESLSAENLRRVGKSHALGVDYSAAVRRLQRHGLGVSAGAVFGLEHDDPGVFERTLDFAVRHQLCLLQVAPVVPFPGTPLRARLLREGRAVDADWSRYDFSHAVFEPKGMSRAELEAGMEWLRRRYYALPSIARRVLGGAGALGVRAAAFNGALNWAYRRNQRRGYRFPP